MSRQRETPAGWYLERGAGGESFEAFVPNPLPPTDPPIQWTEALFAKYELAALKLGEINGWEKKTLPDTKLLTYLFMRQEAVLSSQIEGTRSTLTDLLEHEMDGSPQVSIDDRLETINYLAAWKFGIKALDEGRPIDMQLIKQMHAILLRSGRGSELHNKPGEFRTTQNWIGGTKLAHADFVPPPAPQVESCMHSLERFINDDSAGVSDLVRAALAHLQFETIHPFLDGNGRIGRLLILLILYSRDKLQHSMFYPSLYFRAHRQNYYRLLNQVRNEGRWISWLAFFADAISDSAGLAMNMAHRLQVQFEEDAQRIREQAPSGSRASSMQRVHRAVLQYLIVNIKTCTKVSELTHSSVASALEVLQSMGIVHEMTGQKRNRLYGYKACLDIVRELIPDHPPG